MVAHLSKKGPELLLLVLITGLAAFITFPAILHHQADLPNLFLGISLLVVGLVIAAIWAWVIDPSNRGRWLSHAFGAAILSVSLIASAFMSPNVCRVQPAASALVR